MSAPSESPNDDGRELHRILKETILNVESLVEEAERVLRRAQARLAKFEIEYGDKLYDDDD